MGFGNALLAPLRVACRNNVEQTSYGLTSSPPASPFGSKIGSRNPCPHRKISSSAAAASLGHCALGGHSLKWRAGHTMQLLPSRLSHQLAKLFCSADQLSRLA